MWMLLMGLAVAGESTVCEQVRLPPIQQATLLPEVREIAPEVIDSAEVETHHAAGHMVAPVSPEPGFAGIHQLQARTVRSLASAVDAAHVMRTALWLWKGYAVYQNTRMVIEAR